MCSSKTLFDWVASSYRVCKLQSCGTELYIATLVWDLFWTVYENSRTMAPNWRQHQERPSPYDPQIYSRIGQQLAYEWKLEQGI